MSNVNRRRKDDRRAELQKYTQWLESEYMVSVEWEYTPRGMLGKCERALAICIATGVGEEGPANVRWEVSGEIIVDPSGVRELKAHMEVLSRLMMDLQIERMYGIHECEYALFAPRE